MYCHSPTVAYRYIGINPDTGKPYKPFKFFPFKDDASFLAACNRSLPDGYERLILPCQRCLLCTRRYRKMWSLRILHELRSYTRACCLCLTVSDDFIDSVFPRLDGSVWHSLSYKPFQNFMKRLRRHLDYYDVAYDKPLRFFMCGEYGDEFHRPHYHVILFGFAPADCVPLVNKPGLFVSSLISQLWPFGVHSVSSVDAERASYIAGYVDKKLDNDRMCWVDNHVNPEFVSMSRGCKKLGTGGIGKSFFDKFCDSDLYPENSDGSFVRTCAVDRRGYYVKMPKYYDDLLLLRDPEKFDRMIAARKVGASELDLNLEDWLNESHRKYAVACAKRKKREPGVHDLGLVQRFNVA